MTITKNVDLEVSIILVLLLIAYFDVSRVRLVATLDLLTIILSNSDENKKYRHMQKSNSYSTDLESPGGAVASTQIITSIVHRVVISIPTAVRSTPLPFGDLREPP